MSLPELLRLAFDFTRYQPNLSAWAYWACAGYLFVVGALSIADRSRALEPARRAFAGHVLINSFTVLALGAMCAAGDAQHADALARLWVGAVALGGPSALTFVCSILGWTRQLRILRTVLWVKALVIVGVALATNLLTDGVLASRWGFTGRAGPLAPFLFLHILVGSVVIKVLLVGRMRAGDLETRRQLSAVLAAYTLTDLVVLDLLGLWGHWFVPSLWMWLTVATILLGHSIRQHDLIPSLDLGPRSVAWGLASLGVLAVPAAVALLPLGSWWGSPLPTAILLFGAVMATRAYLGRVQPRLDDVFLRRSRNLERELDALSDKLLVLHTADALARAVEGLLARTLFVRLAAFAVREEPGGWRLVQSAWGTVSPPDDRDFATGEGAPAGVLRRGGPEAGGPGGLARLFERYGAELLLVIPNLGLLAIGPRRDGAPFATYELEFMARLRESLAGPLAAAGLYDRRHRLRLELEAKVAARTADLGRALEGLRSAQHQLVQSEKMATLGLVVAGVAVELEAAVEAVSTQVPVLSGQAKVYEEVAEACLTALPAGAAADELRAWAGEDPLAFVRRDLGPLVDAIGEGARRARGISSALGRFARADGEVREPVELHRELDATLNLLRHDLEGRVEVRRAYAAELPLVEVDRGPIGQVFLNLFINAIQAIDGPGVLEVGTRALEGPQRVEVTVRDSGKGIAPEHLSRIFEPFFTTKSLGVRGGSGLGLSISYGIVERHGGRIEVTSVVGEGTTFRVTLPVRGQVGSGRSRPRTDGGVLTSIA